MTAPIDAATVDALALADLGQKVLNAITLTKIQGLATVQSAVGTYTHSSEPAAQLVAAVVAGQIAAVDAALARWIEAKPAIAHSYRRMTTTDAPDPLRGDCLSPTVQRVSEVAALLRATAAEPELDVPETVPVLAPGQLTAAQVRDRAGMAGTVLVLAGVVGCVLGVLWAHLGGAL